MGLLISTALFAQETMPQRPPELPPFSGSVTSVTIWAAGLYVLAKLGEFAIKIAELLKDRNEKDENSKILGDLIRKTAECDRASENVTRLSKELEQCDAEREKCQSKADEWRNKYYEIREELAMLKSIEPPSSTGSTRIGRPLQPPLEGTGDAK